MTLAPSRPLTVWVGTGENNSQRSVGWGDGVYRSDDGGRNWTPMGLKASEHIGRIVVHPMNPEVVWVAAQGPLWASGGDRGVYKTTDGGRTWKRVLHVDDWTGANEVHLDPHDPNVLYASTYQRHRKVWTLVNGGPGSGLWKSVDGGETWTRLKNGLPGGDMGRIGLVVPPNERDVIVATVEASAESRGTYRSEDGGANWSKLNGQVSSSPQYYQELFADPSDRGRLYMIDTFLQASDDGGRTWKRAGEANKHVDNHVVWVDPRDSRHLIVGCDGGLYETFDRCATWNFFANLPITQFYKVEVDQDLPFFNVYGGTQDNATWGGPSRTANDHGIRNSDWWFVLGGDGFQPRVDPTDPNIVYGSYQHGELYRFDRRSGERTEIQPQPEPGEPGSRWNWDSPLIISPHSHTRLYFASQRVYRSDDRGDTWRAVSPDLTAGIDRNRLPVMGRVQSVDAIAKNMSTSIYGNIVWVDESPIADGLLVVGTDDGLVWVSEDAGANWRRVDTFPGVGPYAYVSRVVPSRHARNTLFATFDRHKMGEFKPYVLRSDDLGRTWTNVAGDLPANGSVYAFVEDHQQPGLWFVGTEFGVFVTPDAGRRWVQTKGGLPVACIRDLAI
ncbi:MAG: WD40/YVTN/BNR-like repeat-containing protein, partial [bacterium]